MIEIKRLDKDIFCETLLDSFDRYQEVQNVFRMENGRLVLKKQPFTETWSPERRREKAAEILSGKYITYCVFDGDMNLPLDGQRELVEKTLSRLPELREMKCGTTPGEKLWKEKIDYQIGFYRKLMDQIQTSCGF